MTITTTETKPPEIQGFRYLRLLGAGESSDVFLYAWPEARAKVAVKVWRQPLTAEAREAVAQETTAVAALAAHPHLVPLHAVGVDQDGRSFVIMDHLPGADLQERSQTDTLGVEQALSVTIAMAGAVGAAARRGILHGDVKPANILTTGGGVPQLVGFGHLSSVGRAAGTGSSSLPWLPPEMLEDPPEPSVWVDVWGLAATCYTLLAGRTPFEVPGLPNTPDDLAVRIKGQDLPPTGREGVPESLERALRKAMAKRRAERYWSAADFATALQQVQVELGQPVMPIEDVPEQTEAPERAVEVVVAPEGVAPEAVAASAPPIDATTPIAAVGPRPTGPPPTAGPPKVAPRPAPTEKPVRPVVKVGPSPEPEGEDPAAERAAIYTVSFPTSRPAPEAGVVPPPAPPPALERVPERVPEAVAEAVAPSPVTEKTPSGPVRPDATVEEDLLGYAVEADRLARLLASRETISPLAVALQAPRGSGRSTFLTQLQARIDALGEDGDAYVDRIRHVRFNALHRGADRDVMAVIGELRDALVGGPAASAPESEWTLAAERLRAAERRRAELRTALDGMSEDPSEDTGRNARRRPRAEGLGAGEALAAADREVSAREAVLWRTPPVPAAEASLLPAVSAAEAGEPTVGSAYEELCELAASAAVGAERVVLYIDDLDRCDAVRASAVLQAVELITRMDGFVVVAGVDPGWLQRAVAVREPDPVAYLERVFQVPFALGPVAGDAAVRYMRSLVGKPALVRRSGAGTAAARGADGGALALSDGEAVFVGDLARFCGSPRAVEKLLTLYRTARTAPGAGGTPDSYQPLGVLVAIVVGAPVQAPLVLDAVLDAVATGGGAASFGQLLEAAADAHRCDLPGCETRAAWRRVVAAYAHLRRVQGVPEEVAAYVGWVEEVSRYTFARAHGAGPVAGRRALAQN